jgi:hypothetical protein
MSKYNLLRQVASKSSNRVGQAAVVIALLHFLFDCWKYKQGSESGNSQDKVGENSSADSHSLS